MNTTAGSYSLLGSVVPDDAGVVKRLRKAGAIVLGAFAKFECAIHADLGFTGKASMSEFAHFRSERMASGWSGIVGQNTNAYYPNADPCGSSSGSGVAASIGLAAVTLGTETDGSIICPSSHNNLAGVKPTVGLTSRAGGMYLRLQSISFAIVLDFNGVPVVIPISEHQDTVGPMARSVTDAAIVLSVIAGRDPNDKYTLSQPPVIPDYTRALDKNALKGKRIGVPRRTFLNDSITQSDPSVNAIFEQALATIRRLGATIIDPADLPSADELVDFKHELFVTNVDFKVGPRIYTTNY